MVKRLSTVEAIVLKVNVAKCKIRDENRVTEIGIYCSMVVLYNRR